MAEGQVGRVVATLEVQATDTVATAPIDLPAIAEEADSPVLAKGGPPNAMITSRVDPELIGARLGFRVWRRRDGNETAREVCGRETDNHGVRQFKPAIRRNRVRIVEAN
jgi:hypothetical protein